MEFGFIQDGGQALDHAQGTAGFDGTLARHGTGANLPSQNMIGSPLPRLRLRSVEGDANGRYKSLIPHLRERFPPRVPVSVTSASPREDIYAAIRKNNSDRDSANTRMDIMAIVRHENEAGLLFPIGVEALGAHAQSVRQQVNSSPTQLLDVETKQLISQLTEDNKALKAMFKTLYNRIFPQAGSDGGTA
jgi:hypothetical protein